MVKQIFWTETAKMSLKIIFDYYKTNVNILIANKIKNKILDDIKLLESGFFVTAKEPLLSNFEKEYRYFVSDSYKIIYFVDNQKIIISLVFDARQNPEKLYNIIKKDINIEK